MASNLRNQRNYLSTCNKRKAFIAFAGAMGSVVPLLFQPGSASAATTLTWDPTMAITSPTGGAGTWDLATSNWSNGTADNLWTDTNGGSQVAVFAGTGGTVTLNTNLGAQALTFDSDGYTISGTGLLTLAGASNNTGFFVAAGVSATIDNPVTWRGNSPTIGITPGSTLTFGGTFTGATSSKPTFLGGTLVLDGDASTWAGSLEMSTSNTAAATSGQPTIAASPNGTIVYGATTGTLGTSVAIITVAEGATLEADQPLNIIGNLQMKDGVGVTNSNLTGSAPVNIANLYDNNTNGELYNTLSGTGATLTLGTNSTNGVYLAGTSASTLRMFSIGGTADTIINATMNDYTSAVNTGTVGANTGKDNFNWNDTGTLTLNAANQYGGSTFLSAGTTVLGVANALPTTTSVTMGALTGTNAILDLNGNSQTLTSIGVASGSALSYLASTSSANSAILKFTGTSPVGMAIGQTVSNPSLPVGTTILGIVTQNSGETDITVSSPATAAMSGNVVFSAANASNNQVIGSSSTTSGSALSLTGASTFAGTIQDTLGAGNQQLSLNILSTGSLNLTGTNTYTGNTLVTGGGALEVSPGGSLGATNVNVDSLSTLSLTGGTLDYNLLSVGPTSSIVDNGVLNVTGTNIIDVTSSDVALTPGGLYTLISDPNGFADTATSFEFPNLTDTEVINVGGNNYTLTLSDPLSTSVTLSVIPEPATLSLLGLSALGFLRRRRRA
jgi:autotransporter-associated beta strand protein